MCVHHCHGEGSSQRPRRFRVPFLDLSTWGHLPTIPRRVRSQASGDAGDKWLGLGCFASPRALLGGSVTQPAEGWEGVFPAGLEKSDPGGCGGGEGSRPGPQGQGLSSEDGGQPQSLLQGSHRTLWPAGGRVTQGLPRRPGRCSWLPSHSLFPKHSPVRSGTCRLQAPPERLHEALVAMRPLTGSQGPQATSLFTQGGRGPGAQWGGSHQLMG